MTHRCTGRVRTAVLVALMGLMASTGVAGAAGCPSEPSSQVFLSWGDVARYALAPDGGFEGGASGWKLDGGASVAEANETFHVGGAGDSRSLALPAGAAAETPPVCVSVAHPTIRLFARNEGDASSALRVSVVYRTLLGLRVTLAVGQVGAGPDWEPTLPVPIVVNLLSLVGGNDVVFRFAPVGDGGDWSIDDVYVDPWSKG